MRTIRSARSAALAALAAAWMLGVGRSAAAQDAAGPDAGPAAAPDARTEPETNPPSKPAPGAPASSSSSVHPLQRLRGEALRASHRSALRLLDAIRSAQASVRASGAIDADNDGVGEAATLQELANAIDHIRAPGSPPRFRESYLRPEFGQVDANGVATVAGYCFRVWLPGKGGTFVSETPGARGAGVDADAGEDEWGVYAWPAQYGTTGRFTFFVNDAEVLVADLPAHSGAANGPEPTAALMAPDPPGRTGKRGVPSLVATATPGEKGLDGNLWRDATSVQPSELDAPPAPRLDVWHDEKLLAEALASACDAVAAAAGAPFDAEHGGRPTARFARFDEVAAAILEESAPQMTRFGVPAAAHRAAADRSAGAMLAKYLPASHVILVVPETAEVTAAVAASDVFHSADGLRAVLLHEVAHAHMLRRHPLVAAVNEAETQDELVALGAVIEGHAQWLAARAARVSGTADGFEKFSAALTFPPRAPGESRMPMLRVLQSVVTFPYVEGRRFFDAVEAARGIAGVEEALREPPREPRMIERPVRWIERAERAGRFSAAQRATTVFGSIVPKDWSVVPQAMTVSGLRAAAESLVGAEELACLTALDDLRVTTASRGGDMLVVAALSFDDEASAAAYLAVARSMHVAQDASPRAIFAATITDNAPPARPGFVARRTITRDGIALGTVTWVERIRTVVVEASLGGNTLAESEIGRAFEKIAATAPPEEKR